jgi:hypothetical protein
VSGHKQAMFNLLFSFFLVIISAPAENFRRVSLSLFSLCCVPFPQQHFGHQVVGGWHQVVPKAHKQKHSSSRAQKTCETANLTL